MTKSNVCPICDYALDASAVKATVAGAEHLFCCDDCAKQAIADPSRLKSKSA